MRCKFATTKTILSRGDKLWLSYAVWTKKCHGGEVVTFVRWDKDEGRKYIVSKSSTGEEIWLTPGDYFIEDPETSGDQ